jgi:hypothetical protein
MVIAMPGIHVGAGGVEGITVPDGITVTGGNGLGGEAVLDCQGSGRGFTIGSGQAEIYNMTARRCSATGQGTEGLGGGILISGGSPTLAGVVVEQCGKFLVLSRAPQATPE